MPKGIHTVDLGECLNGIHTVDLGECLNGIHTRGMPKGIHTVDFLISSYNGEWDVCAKTLHTHCGASQFRESLVFGIITWLTPS